MSTNGQTHTGTMPTNGTTSTNDQTCTGIIQTGLDLIKVVSEHCDYWADRVTTESVAADRGNNDRVNKKGISSFSICLTS